MHPLEHQFWEDFAMAAASAVRLPGTLHGLLDAGQDLYGLVLEADELHREALAALAAVERALKRGDDATPLLFEISATLRLCDSRRRRVLEALRRYDREGPA